MLLNHLESTVKRSSLRQAYTFNLYHYNLLLSLLFKANVKNQMKTDVRKLATNKGEYASVVIIYVHIHYM